MSVSDQHSIQFDFECLDIEVDGLMFAEVNGTAELAPNGTDDGYFYVKYIVLTGDRYKKAAPYMALTLKKREPGKIYLLRPSLRIQTFEAHLFRAIEYALYRHRPAIDAWQNELEEAKP